MESKELRGVGPVLAARLEEAGLGTVEGVAEASIETLSAVVGIGPSRSVQLKNQARTMLAASPLPGSASIDGRATAKAVKRLHRAAPELAKSKKHAKALKTSARRMSGWIDDLERQKVRKRLIAETDRIKEKSRKHTGSKKDARKLEKLADRIEHQVRKIA